MINYVLLFIKEILAYLQKIKKLVVHAFILVIIRVQVIPPQNVRQISTWQDNPAFKEIQVYSHTDYEWTPIARTTGKFGSRYYRYYTFNNNIKDTWVDHKNVNHTTNIRYFNFYRKYLYTWRSGWSDTGEKVWAKTTPQPGSGYRYEATGNSRTRIVYVKQESYVLSWKNVNRAVVTHEVSNPNYCPSHIGGQPIRYLYRDMETGLYLCGYYEPYLEWLAKTADIVIGDPKGYRWLKASGSRTKAEFEEAFWVESEGKWLETGLSLLGTVNLNNSIKFLTINDKILTLEWFDTGKTSPHVEESMGYRWVLTGNNLISQFTYKDGYLNTAKAIGSSGVSYTFNTKGQVTQMDHYTENNKDIMILNSRIDVSYEYHLVSKTKTDSQGINYHLKIYEFKTVFTDHLGNEETYIFDEYGRSVTIIDHEHNELNYYYQDIFNGEYFKKFRFNSFK